MNVNYTRVSNFGAEEFNKPISEFLLEFPFMFTVDLIPPVSAVNDLLLHGPSAWQATNRFDWEKFHMTLEQYRHLSLELRELKGYASAEVPKEVDTAYKWSIWQYQLKYGIPYEKHKALMDTELDCTEKMAAAGEKGDDELMLFYHLERARVADEIQCLFDEYIKR